MMCLARKFGSWLGLILFVGVMAWTPAMAQDSQETGAPPQASTNSRPKPAGTTSPAVVLGQSQDSADQPAPVTGSVNPYSAQIKDAGTGLPLFGASSTPLRWGDFSIGSFEYLGMHDNFEPTGSSVSSDFNLSMFRTSLMFDHSFWKSRLVLQYLPQLAILNGQVHANAGTNNTFSIGSKFLLTPRLSLTVQNSLVQIDQNQIIPENYLATDWAVGATSQNNYLNSNGNYLSDSTSATFEYSFSPRTSISLTPAFQYAHAISTSSTSPYQVDGFSYQGNIAVSHALSPHRQIGISDFFQYLQEDSNTASDARYNTISGFYSEQLAPTWWISGNLGATHQNGGNQSGGKMWSLSGGASLVGSFTRSLGIALGYSRGVWFNNYISTRLSDRIDGDVGIHLASNITWNNGVGYFREYGSDPRTSAKYATSGIQYAFYGNLSLFATFSHIFQSSNTVQLMSGTRNAILFGIQWRPPLYPAR
jgi:hypothetical protein